MIFTYRSNIRILLYIYYNYINIYYYYIYVKIWNIFTVGQRCQKPPNCRLRRRLSCSLRVRSSAKMVGFPDEKHVGLSWLVRWSMPRHGSFNGCSDDEREDSILRQTHVDSFRTSETHVVFWCILHSKPKTENRSGGKRDLQRERERHSNCIGTWSWSPRGLCAHDGAKAKSLGRAHTRCTPCHTMPHHAKNGHVVRVKPHFLFRCWMCRRNCLWFWRFQQLSQWWKARQWPPTKIFQL